MTRADLYDWVVAHKCEITPLAEHKANVIKVVNPKNKAYAYINLPIDERPIRDYTAFTVCTRLVIPIPTNCVHMKTVHDRIQRDNDQGQE